jgi:signal transduction histidine kinase
VLANLIGNAIKYIGKDNPAPCIQIKCDVRGSTVRYEIIDNGVGIPDEHVGSLFEKFSRFHHMKADGPGLGLSIVLGIINKLGGTVGVETQIGQGSNFWFELPACPE